jgi:alkane 1-monooxygenase
VGVVNGTIGFALAHEFIHKFSFVPKVAGYILLLSAGYLHYSIEHVHGHHVYACTPKDPNSAKRGESFYQFFVRSVTGSFINAWKIEIRRLRKINRPFLSASNRMLMFMLVQTTILFILSVAFGGKALLFFIAQALVAISIHQQVNYLQHYGLTRSDNGSIREKMHAHHSWSIRGNCRIVDLFQVQNHADHHIHASTPYHQLKAIDESPKLPANYATMMLVTLIPPLWFKIIHKRLPSSL